MRLPAAWGYREAVEIPRQGVTRKEVEQTLERRLVSRYTVTAGSKNESDPVKIQVHAKRSERDGDRGSVTVRVVPSNRSTNIEVQPESGRVRTEVRTIRRLLRSAPELRVSPIKPIKPTADDQVGIPDSLASLLSVYAGQFGSYTTLLWQVPALGLTAQSFLLTIALMKDTSGGARIVACVLSMIIALASGALMHNQRGRAINHAELLRRLSEKLGLSKFLGGSVELDDGVPKKTNAQNLWAVDHLIYHGWIWCMWLFMIADILIIFAVGLKPSLLTV